jgi:hypothetical protein
MTIAVDLLAALSAPSGQRPHGDARAGAVLELEHTLIESFDGGDGFVEGHASHAPAANAVKRRMGTTM